RASRDSFRHETHRLDLVAVGIADEGAVVVGVAFGTQARRPGIGAAVRESDAVKRVDLRAALGDEGDVHAVADARRLAVERFLETEADRRRAVVDRASALVVPP